MPRLEEGSGYTWSADSADWIDRIAGGDAELAHLEQWVGQYLVEESER